MADPTPSARTITTTELRRAKRTRRKVRAFLADHPRPEPHDPLRAGVEYLATLVCDRNTTRQPDVTT